MDVLASPCDTLATRASCYLYAGEEPALLTTIAAFLGVSVLVIVTPGQDTALTIRNTLLGGRRGGSSTALGVAAGQAVWTAASSAGLAGLLLASQPAFGALKVAGTAYLAWLALHAIRDAIRGERPSTPWPAPPGGRTAPAVTPIAAFRQGVVSNLSNPKMVVFFVSLLPQFAPAGGASFIAMLALGLLFCLLTLTWLALYSAVVAKVGDVLRRPTVRRVLHGVLGAVFVGLGVRLATLQR
jgi:threonine/homoserine/homoserine lactone efflux protein